MKSFLINMKNKIRQATKGFPLVELIVVIAIMAIMVAVLAPSLLGYVEKSRMQKDDSAMNEVSSALHLSLADQNVYDELVPFVAKDNYSCYCDGDLTTNIYENQTPIKGNEYWLYNDNCRLLDETVYKPAGKMRGVTITLKPNGSAEYILKDGIVNKIGNDTTKKGANAGKVLNDCPELYNRLRSTVGDTIKVSSQTYRNSDYTIFISMGTTGGNQADKQDAIQVYGQYNGTNLSEVAPASNINSNTQAPMYNHNDELLHQQNIIPEGGTYYVGVNKSLLGDYSNATQILNAGDSFPMNTQAGDVYVYGDYEYRYNYRWYSEERGWDGIHDQKGWAPRVLNATKTSYAPVLESINDLPITSLYNSFSNCFVMLTAPEIPKAVTEIGAAFDCCYELQTPPHSVPENVINMVQTFRNCNKLAISPELNKAYKLTNMRAAFFGCRSLIQPPVIPDSVKNMDGTFFWCDKLKSAPIIPSGVQELTSTFQFCMSLQGPITIHANPTEYDNCLYSTQITEVTGDSLLKEQLLATK